MDDNYRQVGSWYCLQQKGRGMAALFRNSTKWDCCSIRVLLRLCCNHKSIIRRWPETKSCPVELEFWGFYLQRVSNDVQIALPYRQLSPKPLWDLLTSLHSLHCTMFLLITYQLFGIMHDLQPSNDGATPDKFPTYDDAVYLLEVVSFVACP